MLGKPHVMPDVGINYPLEVELASERTLLSSPTPLPRTSDFLLKIYLPWQIVTIY